jgi:hypothetical protein
MSARVGLAFDAWKITGEVVGLNSTSQGTQLVMEWLKQSFAG